MNQTEESTRATHKTLIGPILIIITHFQSLFTTKYQTSDVYTDIENTVTVVGDFIYTKYML